MLLLASYIILSTHAFQLPDDVNLRLGCISIVAGPLLFFSVICTLDFMKEATRAELLSELQARSYHLSLCIHLIERDALFGILIS